MKKLTYTDALDIAIASVSADSAVAEKLTALKASLEKKSHSKHKPTANQTANAGYKEVILAGMEDGKSYTITDLNKNIDGLSELSNQKISALVRQLVESGKVIREQVKRKAYFHKA